MPTNEISQVNRDTRKKVVLLAQYFPPESSAGAKRLRYMAEALGGRYRLTVVALQPSHPSPEHYRGTVVDDSGQPFRVVRAFPFVPHRGGMLVRALRELVMAFRLARLARHERPEIVLTSSPSMFLGPAARWLARRTGAAFVWDLRDATWQYAEEHGQAGALKGFLTGRLKSWMLATGRSADLVTTANSGIAGLMRAGGVSEGKVLEVPNGISPDFLAAFSDEPSPGLRPGKFVVSYIGLLGLPQGLGTLLGVAERLPGVTFQLIGDGAERAAIEEGAARRGLKNVLFPGFLSGPALTAAYRDSDVLFAQLRDLPTLANAAWPTKLFEYMAACRPIVYAAKGLAAAAIAGVGAGLVVAPEDAEAIAAAIGRLQANPAEAAEMARRGRAHVLQNCHRDRLMAAMADELQKRFGGR